MNLNRSDLVAKVAESAGIPKVVAEKALLGLLGAVSETLTAGGKVTLVGFGIFEVLERKPRKGRNPQTGAPVEIPAAKVVRFRAGKELAERVR